MVLRSTGNRIQQDTYDPSSTLTQTLSSQYDTLNRLAKRIGAQGQTTDYQYDNNDNPTAVTENVLRTFS